MHRAPTAAVRCYRAYAYQSFRLQAKGELYRLLAMGLGEDWDQEIALAAFQAERAAMTAKQATRFFQREAYHALRRIGFHRIRRGGRQVYVLDEQLGERPPADQPD